MRIAFRKAGLSLAAVMAACVCGCPVAAQTAISFQPPITYDRPVPAPLYGVSGTPLITGDWDSDGRLDLCVITREGFSLLWGNGDGTFAPPVDYPLGPYLQEGVAADVNGDGKPDLVLCQFALGKVLVLLNKGGRQFAPPVNYPVPDHPVGVTAADFNGDGAVDLAVSCHEVGTLCVMLNRGDGTFLPPTLYGGWSYGGGIVSADFNGDGKMDLAQTSLTQNQVRVLLGDGTGKFIGIGGFPTSTDYANRIAADDFNGDGIPDLVVPSLGSYAVLFGDGTGRFGAAVRYLGYQVMDVGDFDGDGDPDLVAPGGDVSGLSIFQNYVGGNFLNAATIPGPGTKSTAARVGDFNGDGRPDVIVWDEASPHLLVYLNNTPRAGTVIRSLVLNPGTIIAGCEEMKGMLTLTAAAPAGGAVVLLTSSNSALRPPVSVTVPEGEASVAFPVAADSVASAQGGFVLASYNGSGRRAGFLLKPAGVVGLTLNPASIIGGQSSVGQITLRCAAGSQGVTIPLKANRADLVQLPAAVVVPAGATSTVFPLDTRAVNALTAVVITAQIDGQKVTAALEVRPVPPPPPPRLLLFPNPVVGGQHAMGQVELSRPAGPGGEVISLASSNPVLAVVPATIVVPPGSTGMTFPISTSLVSNPVPVIITARGLSGTATATLQLVPPPPLVQHAPASPTNLVAERVLATSIDLRWQDNSDHEEEFVVWRRSGGGEYVRVGSVGANVTAFSDIGLQPRTTYSYVVRAWNLTGASGRSNEVTVQTPAQAPPSGAPHAPSALLATAISATAISLSWQDNSSDEAAFVLYRQEPGGQSEKIATLPANSTSYVDRGLRPGTTYRYLLRAWNPQSGASRASNEASAATPFAQ